MRLAILTEKGFNDFAFIDYVIIIGFNHYGVRLNIYKESEYYPTISNIKQFELIEKENNNKEYFRLVRMLEDSDVALIFCNNRENVKHIENVCKVRGKEYSVHIPQETLDKSLEISYN